MRASARRNPLRCRFRIVLGCRDARADRLVDALDLGGVQGAPGVAGQQRPGHLQRRHRLVAALDHGACSAGEDLAALQKIADAGVILVLLKGLERFEARVRVIEADDESHVHAIVIEVVQEAAAIGLGVERPAEGVLNEAGFDPRGGSCHSSLIPRA